MNDTTFKEGEGVGHITRIWMWMKTMSNVWDIHTQNILNWFEVKALIKQMNGSKECYITIYCIIIIM